MDRPRSARSEDELCLVIAALTARGLPPREIHALVAQFLAFQSLERRLPVPDVRFDLEGLSKSRCIDRFRFTAKQIKALHYHLNLPEKIHTAQAVPVPGIEALCLVLRRLSYPCRYTDLAFEFGRPSPVLSSAFNMTLLLIHCRVAKKMAFDELIFSSYAAASASSVYGKVGYVKNCIAFIDGTMRRICRPVEFQNEVYSGFKKVHCIKFQGVMLANGLLVSLYGPVEGRRHDSFMLSSSKIEQKIVRLFPDRYLYGDAGYGIRGWLLRPHQTAGIKPNEKRFNKALSKARVSVEWFFGEVVQYWAHIDYRKGMKIGKSPVGAMYIVASFLTNALMCANAYSKSSKYFNCPLPSLEGYMENIDPNAVPSCVHEASEESDDDEDMRQVSLSAIHSDDDEDMSQVSLSASGSDDEERNKDQPSASGSEDVHGQVDEDDDYEQRELPEADLQIVIRALHEGPESEVLVKKYGIPISRGCMACMLPLQWLNDDVINFWFHMLSDRDAALHAEGFVQNRSFFFSSFFYSQLLKYGYTAVSRWTKKIDLFGMDKVFIPVNLSNTHWCLAVIFVAEKRIQYYDSMGGPGHGCLRRLLGYLEDEMQQKRAEQLDVKEWTIVPTERSTPQQENGSDCGLFACIFADYISRNQELTFSQRDMAFHRRRMILHIVQGLIPIEENF